MEVTLRFFENDGIGLAPEATIEHGFNAFWASSTGIYHDVFEHYFEYEHRYFRGKNCCNLAGEVVAMGHLIYYVGVLGVSRKDASETTFVDINRIYGDTLPYMKEFIDGETTQYLSEWVCPVPKQQPIKGIIGYSLEVAISEHLYLLNKHYEMREIQKHERKIKDWHIASLYRWGFRKAMRMVPKCDENRIVLDEFIKYWENYTKYTDPREEMSMWYRGIRFKIKPGKPIKWTAYFITHTGKEIHYKKKEDYENSEGAAW